MEPNERKVYAHPVFGIVRADGRHFRWLASRIGYSHSHVKNVAGGHFPASPRFRAACATLLGMPERELFHGAPSEPTSADSVTRDGTAAGQAYATEEAPSLSISA